MNKETLEETAEKYYNNNIFCDGITEFEHDIAIRCYIAGAKLQAERMYSEEDLISFAHFYFKEEFNSTMQTSKSTDEILQEWFEQFKK